MHSTAQHAANSFGRRQSTTVDARHEVQEHGSSMPDLLTLGPATMSSYMLFTDCYSLADGDGTLSGFVDTQTAVDHGCSRLKH